MKLAPGMREAIAKNAEFDTPQDGAEFWSADPPQVSVRDIEIAGADGRPRPARLYGDGPDGLLWIHGGGWTQGSIGLNDRSSRLALKLGAVLDEAAPQPLPNKKSLIYRHPRPEDLR